MNVLDLFSGIGGFSLGLERAGMRTVAFCEIEPYCRDVLAKHWPGVPCFPDIRQLRGDWLGRIDVICGGFPCQDISYAGAGAGITGARSGLWGEYARLIGELRPQYVIVENVSALLNRGLGRVLGDLAALGYDAEWHCIPASYVGAPHRRDRIWIVAYPSSNELRNESGWRSGSHGESSAIPGNDGAQGTIPDADCEGQHDGAKHAEMVGAPEPHSHAAAVLRVAELWREQDRDHGSPQEMAHANVQGLQERRQTGFEASQSQAVGGMAFAEPERYGSAWWEFEPDVGRVANGVPFRVDRLKSLGNAVVPQVVEIIGRAIMSAHETCSEQGTSEVKHGG